MDTNEGLVAKWAKMFLLAVVIYYLIWNITLPIRMAWNFLFNNGRKLNGEKYNAYEFLLLGGELLCTVLLIIYFIMDEFFPKYTINMDPVTFLMFSVCFIVFIFMLWLITARAIEGSKKERSNVASRVFTEAELKELGIKH